MKGETMRDTISHLSDQDLLLFADGELSRTRSAQARAHLVACWSCRARLRKMEDTVSDVANIYAREFDPRSSSEAGLRARLKAQLSDLAMTSRPSMWGWIS